jgi:hypothetical protein
MKELLLKNLYVYLPIATGSVIDFVATTESMVVMHGLMVHPPLCSEALQSYKSSKAIMNNFSHFSKANS